MKAIHKCKPELRTHKILFLEVPDAFLKKTKGRQCVCIRVSICAWVLWEQEFADSFE